MDVRAPASAPPPTTSLPPPPVQAATTPAITASAATGRQRDALPMSLRIGWPSIVGLGYIGPAAAERRQNFRRSRPLHTRPRTGSRVSDNRARRHGSG